MVSNTYNENTSRMAKHMRVTNGSELIEELHKNDFRVVQLYKATSNESYIFGNYFWPALRLHLTPKGRKNIWLELSLMPILCFTNLHYFLKKEVLLCLWLGKRLGFKLQYLLSAEP